jgi:hypothetical protein
MPQALIDAPAHATTIGGAHPKALLSNGDRQLIAKLSSSRDRFPVVKGEFVAMTLAREAGLNVADVELTESALTTSARKREPVVRSARRRRQYRRLSRPGGRGRASGAARRDAARHGGRATPRSRRRVAYTMRSTAAPTIVSGSRPWWA